MKNILRISFLFFVFFLFQNSLTAQESTDFKETDAEKHSFIIIFSDKKIDFAETRAGITKYVWMNHASDGLKLTHILIGENRSVSAMQIEEFENGNEAMIFYNKLKKNRPDFLQMGLTKDYFVVSKTNFNQILLNESLNGYMEFFKSHYLKK